ncbi:hypothetical protein RHMOL_Rhmol05G0320000 [Rhododendron molle]|uniref:Uncharacterized protein n=1 Tax=Rhododendron molle TaxID=49168 RepID=A0ACC0NV92_RHOML|nr:hypothetical protein RHMOL_Rhmol05G0320000 [Rhododendron molle]
MAVVKIPSLVVLYCMVAVLVLVVSVPNAAAQADSLTCGKVQGSLLSCLGYLRRGGPVSAPCCNGVRSLNGLARTTPDRQVACRCLQKAAVSFSGINPGFAQSLPSKCNVYIPYKIGPSTDCSRVK